MAAKKKTKKKATKKAAAPGSVPLKNAKWELFAHLYAGHHNMKMFGNGLQCYSLAYGYTEKIQKKQKEISDLQKKAASGYTVKVAGLESEIKSAQNVCSVESSRLLVNPSIKARCDFLIDATISDEFADRELQYVILQRGDLTSKVAAVREYNRVKSRAVDGKLEGTLVVQWDEPEAAKK